MVQSIIRLTEAPDVATFTRKVEERVAALAAAQDVSGWEAGGDADLRHVARASLAAFGLDERVMVSGGPVLLVPKAAQSVALILHELAVNAAKHGALSVPGGQVAFGWAPDTHGNLVLRWTERNGPPVTAPGRRGFGTTLLETIMQTLNGGLDRDWRAEGVGCTLRLPTGMFRCPTDRPSPSLVLDEPGPPKGRNILVFETDAIVAQAFRHLFRAMGCGLVGPVLTQAEALHLARTADIDAAILEAGFDGTLCGPVADALKERGIPFVICTCRDPAALTGALYPEAIVLGKPFDRRALGAALDLIGPGPVQVPDTGVPA